MSNGYWGKILRVDLSQRKVEEETISELIWKKLLGGAGFGAKVLFDEVGADIAPLDPENRIIFGLGPFQATQVTGAAKFSIVSRSPLTGIYADSAAGADFSIMLKKAGYDGIIIQGRAETPVYLFVNDGKVEIRDGAKVWGKDSYEATELISRELGGNVSVACIGQAGEKEVAIACIVVNKHSFAGRCGLGAVMGSKNLKAVAVRGTQPPPVYDSKRLSALSKEIGKKIFKSTKEWLRLHGTPFVLIPNEDMGDVPIRYWSGDTWREGAQKIGTPYYTETLKAKPTPCKYCVVGCHRHVRIEEPEEYAMEGAGPEYETIAMLGACCLIDDIKAISKAGEWCNRYGIDTMSAGAFVAFAMECFEKVILTKKDTNGMEIRWGDKKALIEIIHQIGQRKGLGGLFGQGIVPAAEHLGKGASEIAMHVKGLDLPAHDPRAYFGLAINYATGTRGGCHERGNPQVASGLTILKEAGITKDVNRFRMENSEFVAARYQDYSALANSLCVCKFMHFGGLTLTDMLEWLNAATGWGCSMEEFLKTGERIFTLQRQVDIKYGVTKKDDILPKRIFEPAKKGARAGKAPMPFKPALDRYYKIRGWDEQGIPKKEKLEELGLS